MIYFLIGGSAWTTIRLKYAQVNSLIGQKSSIIYELTFPALREGLAGFVKVSERAIADALRTLARTTHNLAEGAGAAGLAGLLALRESLGGKTVGICLSGGNIDQETLRRVACREI